MRKKEETRESRAEQSRAEQSRAEQSSVFGCFEGNMCVFWWYVFTSLFLEKLVSTSQP